MRQLRLPRMRDRRLKDGGVVCSTGKLLVWKGLAFLALYKEHCDREIGMRRRDTSVGLLYLATNVAFFFAKVKTFMLLAMLLLCETWTPSAKANARGDKT
jgi:hypothetical protein